MLALGVDTSEPIGSVSLYDGHDLTDERRMDSDLQHARQLVPLIEELLEQRALTVDDIGCVCVNRGPGSFTGLRIGLATAVGLCQATGASLIGIDGAIAYRERIAEVRRVCVIIASRRDLFYAQSFAGSRPKGPVRLVREAELIERLRGEERDMTLVGSGAPRIAAALEGQPKIGVAPEEAHRASALWIAKLGWREEPADQSYEIEPLYVEPLLA